MTDFLITAIAFVVAISVLVAVHEFGHYWVARRLGFKVERFSIGFGRPLLQWWGRDADRVEYRVAAIPLGGYVKMLDERDAEPGATGLERAFNRRPIPHRIAVLGAGPGFNFLFAIIAFWAMYLVGVPGMAPMVFRVSEGSIAATAGLRNDDLIESVDGRPVPTWEAATFALLDEILADGVIDLSVRGDDGATRAVRLDVRGRAAELTEPDALFEALGIDPRPRLPAVIGEVTPGAPADAAGLLADDRIVAVDRRPIATFDELADTVRALPGRVVTLDVVRDGQTLQLPVEIAGVDEDGATVGRIGVGQSRTVPPELLERMRGLQATQKFGPLEALQRGADRTWELTALTVRMIWRMLTGDVSLKTMSGPITIADYAGENVRAGFSPFLNFLAVVSISLGVLNLLPVPILDGGQIVMQVIEWLKGSPLSERALMFGQQVGILFFILLFSFVFYNDLTRVFG
jgi:regulator of sigma E protease